MRDIISKREDHSQQVLADNAIPSDYVRQMFVSKRDSGLTADRSISDGTVVVSVDEYGRSVEFLSQTIDVSIMPDITIDVVIQTKWLSLQSDDPIR